MKYTVFVLLFSFFISFLFSQTLDEWAINGGGTDYDGANGIAIDNDGNVLVTGYFRGTASFGDFSLTSLGETDIFVGKTDPSGHWLWVRRAGSVGDDDGIKIKTDNYGNVYVVGYYSGVSDFGSLNLTSAGSMDIFVAKLDSDGNWLWITSAGGPAYDYAEDIVLDSSGNCYVTGSYYTTAYFGSILTTGSYSEIFVAMINSSGSWQWVVKAGGNSSDKGLGITLDNVGNLYLTGFFETTASFGTISLTSYGSRDCFVAKLSSIGTWLWAVKGGTTSYDAGNDISVDAFGNSYVTGYYTGSGTFGSISLINNGSNDGFVAKLDANGNWLWVRNIGGTSTDWGYGIVTDTESNCYVTGIFVNTITLGPYTLTSSASSYDVYVTKLDTDGNWLFACKAGANSSDFGHDIALDSIGNIYFTGGFCQTVNFGITSLVSYGSTDVFIAKMQKDLLTVLSPNGGENWQVSSLHNIYWKASGYLSTINLQFSVDNGSNWTNINSTPVTASTGSYEYTLPATPSTQCLVKAAHSVGTAVYDISDANFTISSAPSVYVFLTVPTVTALQTGASVSITWLTVGVSNVNLDYSYDGGMSWIPIASGLPATPGSYAWTVPDTPGAYCYIRVSDAANPVNYDFSDASFKIIRLILTSPNGGEVYNTGAVRPIRWSSVHAANLKIEYSSNAGASWTTIIASVSAGSGVFNWTVPNSASANYLVRISDTTISDIKDTSDAVFTVISFRLIYPSASGLKLQTNKICGITWTSELTTGTVRLEYAQNYNEFMVIASGINITDETYVWTVPDSPTTSGRIRIYYEQDMDFVSTSLNTFTVARLDVLTPNGDEIWGEGTVKNITWSSANVNWVNLDYSLNGGSNWVSIAVYQSAATGVYSWTLPTANSANCKVRVSDYNYSAVRDESDNPFTIRPLIIVISPNGGEILQVGSSQMIYFSATTDVPIVYIDYSVDNGANWLPVQNTGYSASLGAFDWTVPDNPSNDCLIKVINALNTSKYDISDAVFTITTLVYPPAAPQNVLISVTGADIQLSWDPVTTDTQSNALTPDGYRIMYSDNSVDYVFLSETAGVSYTDTGAAGSHNRRFYRVIAFIE
ncbi:MAG: hypothetical protein R6V77_01180 [Candidatus Cloacimonadaceae bacterium]